MASLPSVAVNSSLKLDLELRKSSPNSSISTEKSSSISYQRNSTATPSESRPNPKRIISLREALSSIKEGKSIDSAYYVPLLQACKHRNSVLEAEIIHTHIIKTGTHEDLHIMTSLLNVYGKCGRMDYARKIFDEMPERNVISRTALMTGYVQNWQPEFAIQGFQELLECGIYPTKYTITAVLSACSLLRSVEFGKQIHGYNIKYLGESDSIMGNAICCLYSKCGDFESAVKAFRRIPDKDVLSWITAMSACGDNGKPEMGLNFFVEMLLEDIKPNDYSITNVLSLCCLIQASRFGEQIHSFTIKIGFQSDESIKNSIMYLYLKSGLVDEARKLFNGMKDKSLVTWNSIIAGYAGVLSRTNDDLMAHYSGTEALEIYLKLNRSEKKPDMFTFSSILTVCSGLVALEQGEQIHAQTIKSGFLSDVVVGTALVNMYNKCGSLEKATKAFVEMPTRTLVSWTSMITCYAQHGRSQQALQLFEDMNLTGVKPNQITFIAILSACSQAGMVNEALKYFKMMKKKYRIKPVMDHYACLIDMFVRLGKLEEAFDFVTFVMKMDFEPNEVIWSILIAGCRSFGNMELGYYAAERLLELKPKEAESYSLLFNMYRSAGRLEDITKVMKLMEEEKIVRVEDWSSISIKSKVYFFRPDDQSNYTTKEMYKLLEDFIEKAKGLGYVPYRSLEVDDEEDKKNTYTPIVHHSEKLAVVFGLLNMPSGASIRIRKSISMCGDCHNLIKFISVLTGREIIIRDSKRLHRFNDSKCSCGDFVSLL